MNKQQDVGLTNEQSISNLIEEYSANVELWIYEVTYRQQRSQMFLTMNTILLVALSTLMTVSSSLLNSSVIAVLIATFGFPACIMWHRILIRNGEYVRFRYYQLRSIEAQLQNVTTFGNQWRAMRQHEIGLPFVGLEEDFTIKNAARVSTIDLENKFPLFLAGLWVLILLGGAITIGLSITGWI